MRSVSFVRLGIAVCAALALWLASAPMAEAAPLAKRHHARVARCLCESRRLPRRLPARATFDRSQHRPAYYVLRTPRLVVHRHVSTWLERGRGAKPLRDGDSAALQSNAAAVSGEDDQHLLARDKEEVALPGGHVSLVAGPNAVKRMWPKLDQWLEGRST